MDETLAAAAVALCALVNYNFVQIKEKHKTKQSRKRRWWMTSIHRNRTRFTMEKQLSELVAEPCGEFTKFTRMSATDFEYLLSQVALVISKQDTQLREAIPARIRLAITLRFLASGDSFESLHFMFKISPQSISKLIPEVCEALIRVLQEEIKIPSCAEEWLEIERGFRDKFPHAMGSIDGKHIIIQSPFYSGSEYFNYKKTFSIVLLAMVDSNYKFIFADIGSQGRISDGGVFRNSLLWHKITTNTLNLPPSQQLPDSNVEVPYVFLGDGAFALSTHIMKPYPGNHERGSPKRVYNQKLSAARVIVENTFGILSAKFRVFRKPFALCPDKVANITMTCILLHNFLQRSVTSSQIYAPPGTIDVVDDDGQIIQPGSWRNPAENQGAIRNLSQTTRRPSLSATRIREEFTKYFCNL